MMDLLYCHLLSFAVELESLIRIVVTSLPIYECNFYMAGKNIEKYRLWLWTSLVKILDLSHVDLWPLVMTITTSDIFQYFCQPYNNYIHKLVMK